MSFLFPYQHSNTTLEFFTTPAGVCATYCFSPQISKCSHTSSWALLKFSQEDPSGLPIKNYVISIPPPTYLPSYLLFQLNFFDLKNYLVIFNWLMIGLQYWFDFCHTSTWINIGVHIHLSVVRHFGCFHILAIIKIATVDVEICVFLPVSILLFSKIYTPRNGIAE